MYGERPGEPREEYEGKTNATHTKHCLYSSKSMVNASEMSTEEKNTATHATRCNAQNALQHKLPLIEQIYRECLWEE